MRDKYVKSLLDHVKNSLLNIKITYDQSLFSKNLPDSLLVDIKNAMENLRSALDYMTRDIAPEKKIYFPYGKDKSTFEESIKKNLPELKNSRPDIYSLIEGIQPHQCGNTWLYDFCQIVNDNKHNSLSPQIRTTQKSYDVGLTGVPPAISAPAGTIVAPSGAIAIDGIPIEFDQNSGIPHLTPGLTVKITTWVSFVFQGTSIEVYPLLQVAFNNINETSKKLYKII